MSYRVVIEMVTVAEVGPKREYKKLADTGNERDGGPVHGYVEVPDRVETEVVTTQVFEQVVEELDLLAVVRAVNGL